MQPSPDRRVASGNGPASEIGFWYMTEEQTEEQREGTRRRRGSRGGRGRGGRSEGDATEAGGPTAGAGVGSVSSSGLSGSGLGSGIDGAEAPRIVARRPGRPPAAAAEASEASMAPAVVAPTVAVAAPVSRSANPLPEPTDAPEATAPVRRTTRRVASAATEAPEGLLAVMAEQTRLLGMLREEVQRLSEHVDRSARRARLGVFVDVPNLLYGAEPGQRLDMGKLLAILCKDRELVRATAYAPVSDNPSEPVQQQRFVAPFVPYEYRIVTKPLKRFADGSIKGNFDVEMAVDIISMTDRLDVMAIVSGDSDFARVVEEVQSRGVRVEVVAFAGSTSAEMRGLADHYIEVGAIAHLLR